MSRINQFGGMGIRGFDTIKDCTFVEYTNNKSILFTESSQEIIKRSLSTNMDPKTIEFIEGDELVTVHLNYDKITPPYNNIFVMFNQKVSSEQATQYIKETIEEYPEYISPLLKTDVSNFDDDDEKVGKTGLLLQDDLFVSSANAIEIFFNTNPYMFIENSMQFSKKLTVSTWGHTNPYYNKFIKPLFTNFRNGAQGNCLFDAISQAIFGKDDTDRSVRRNVVNFLYNNRYISHLDYESRNWEQYRQRMMQPTEWGTEDEVWAASIYYGIPICALTVNDGLQKIEFVIDTTDINTINYIIAKLESIDSINRPYKESIKSRLHLLYLRNRIYLMNHSRTHYELLLRKSFPSNQNIPEQIYRLLDMVGPNTIKKSIRDYILFPTKMDYETFRKQACTWAKLLQFEMCYNEEDLILLLCMLHK